jgi:hypothetical protein
MAVFKWKGYDLSLELQGFDKLAQMFKDLPGRFSNKVLLKTLRKGGSIVNREIKKQIPATIKGVAGALSIASLDDKDNPAIIAGFFRRQRYFSNKTGLKRRADLKQKGKAKLDAATIAYWFNYGTMANRTGVYRFRTPRKSRTANRTGGIPAHLFFQKGAVAALKPANELVMKEFDGIFQKEFDKLDK